ncbi:hypothetical protein [Candidatus Enterococcus lemimoniae]|uniref:Uncharacterized protein n=1 Tax=Candidatus Enterococcus lemimoniae TaxID=1834167 RepID=A0ABZ2T1X8_9ENTE|nr:hypothetical protein [Enterococcus sp. 12C11_DIV0727]OTO69370.1 hypothetical protein A5866_001570 [Enterococcus sp. 12C11_DIV0727]
MRKLSISTIEKKRNNIMLDDIIGTPFERTPDDELMGCSINIPNPVTATTILTAVTITMIKRCK